MKRSTPLKRTAFHREGPTAPRETHPSAKQAPTVKPKVCAYSKCGKEFIPDPLRPMQKVCDRLCAFRKVRDDKAQERAEVKTRKEAIKTIPDLIREAGVVFNAWIRARDAALPCITCGAKPPDLSQLHAGRDAGHYRSTGSASALRFHEDNCHAQCVECNRWKAGRAVEYRIALVRRIGLPRVEALEADNTPRKWTREELRGIAATYKTKLKELKK